MNKRSLRIAGWAIGLSLAFGAIGTAVGASQKAPIEAEATVGEAVTIRGESLVSAYETGFEHAATSTTYNSTVETTASGSKHTDGLPWSIYYGTVSNGSPLTGSNSLQMRWYSTASGNRPHAQTTGCLSNTDIKAFQFEYKAGNTGWKFDVDYSTNGSSWTTIETITPANTNTNTYSHAFTTAVSNFYLRIATSSSATAPSSGTWQFRVDSVVFAKEVVAVSSVSLDEGEDEISIDVDGTQTLHATVLPENATNKTITWITSNSSIATVTSEGVVTGKGEGSATITAFSDTNKNGAWDENEPKAESAVTVNAFKPVDSVSLNKASLGLDTGDEEQLTATVLPANATIKTVSWNSSDGSVATVDADGIVHAIGQGSATITVTTDSGSKTATCDVTVTDVPVGGISLNKTSTSIVNGGSEQLVATITPVNATNKSVSWSSSATSVATVDADGTVHAVAQGTTVITATSTADATKKATCEITVTDVVEIDQKYILVSEDNNVVMTGINDGNYGEKTDYNDFPLVTYQITIKNGNQTGTYALQTPDGKYLGYEGTKNTLNLTNSVSDSSSWNITVSDGDYSITLYNTTRRIRYNSASSGLRFSTYTSAQQAVQLIKVTDSVVVGSFVETNMKMNQYVGDDSYDASRCSANYGTASSAYAELTEKQQLEFATNPLFADAKARFAQWVAANKDSFNYETGAYTQKAFSIANLSQKNFGSPLSLTLLVVGTGLAAAGGLLFLHRRHRKED